MIPRGQNCQWQVGGGKFCAGQVGRHQQSPPGAKSAKQTRIVTRRDRPGICGRQPYLRRASLRVLTGSDPSLCAEAVLQNKGKHTKTTRGDVGGEHDRTSAGLELGKHPVTLGLLPVEVSDATTPC